MSKFGILPSAYIFGIAGIILSILWVILLSMGVSGSTVVCAMAFIFCSLSSIFIFAHVFRLQYSESR